MHLEDVEAFESHVALNAFGTPSLKTAVPALDPLEVALQPWGTDRELENQCMQALLSDGAKRLLQLNALYTLHKAVVDQAWSATALPQLSVDSSFGYRMESNCLGPRRPSRPVVERS